MLNNLKQKKLIHTTKWSTEWSSKFHDFILIGRSDKDIGRSIGLWQESLIYRSVNWKANQRNERPSAWYSQIVDGRLSNDQLCLKGSALTTLKAIKKSFQDRSFTFIVEEPKKFQKLLYISLRKLSLNLLILLINSISCTH